MNKENKNENFEEDYLDNMIILKDENNREVRFEFLDLIEYQGNEYVILFPLTVDSHEDAKDEIVILKYEEIDSSDESKYFSVDDELILDKIFKIFKEKFKDDFS
jgi:uncharacterized protein YrzB (UPF0473 family)